MSNTKRIFFLALAAALALVLVQALASDSIAKEKSQFEDSMKLQNKSMKAIKASLAKGEMTGVKENAQIIVDALPKTRDFEPPIKKDRKAELPGLNDKSIVAAKALVAATDVNDAKAKFDALGKSCKVCHDIFQPEE